MADEGGAGFSGFATKPSKGTKTPVTEDVTSKRVKARMVSGSENFQQPGATIGTLQATPAANLNCASSIPRHQGTTSPLPYAARIRFRTIP